MVKIVTLIFFLTASAFSENIQNDQLYRDCLSCHIEQKIPSELIYRRYLSSYSVKEKMKQAMSVYLQNPKKENSIMPSQFFLKFPMKEKMQLKEKRLQSDIAAFLEFFDIKKKLILQK